MTALDTQDDRPIAEEAPVGSPADWPAEEEAQHRRKARKWLMPLVVGCYLILLASGLGLAFWVAPRLENDQEAARVKDLMLATTASLQVLAGLVGVVVGYYFGAARE